MQHLYKDSVCFIDGRDTTKDAATRSIHKYYPGDGRLLGQIDFASPTVIEHALTSSRHAQTPWREYTLDQRSEILLRAAQLLRDNLEELAQLEVWDTGKPITEARTVDILSAADCLTYFAKVALANESSVIPSDENLIYTRREPLGICLGIGAWNYPLQIACWKAAPALMMGNVMIYKPAELTPATTLALARIFIQAGMPPGVFNVILGDGDIAKALIERHEIAKISFTGSVATGKSIMRQAAEHLVPVTLELGGKSPLIIFDDADVAEAITGSMLANFYTQGEICSNGTRVYVARALYPRFIAGLQARVAQFALGDPFAPQTQIGAMISEQHMQRVLGYIQQGIAEGAHLLCGGERETNSACAEGYYVQPTILVCDHDNLCVVQEEIFGPVMSVLIFDDEAEVIQRANDSAYGLAAGIFTRDIKRAHRVAQQLQAGVCWINNYNVTPVGMPFGGVKHSGFGRENALITLQQYTQLKSIYVELHQIIDPYALQK